VEAGQPTEEPAAARGPLSGWLTDGRTVIALVGVLLYAVLRVAYSTFYGRFGLTPDDLGLGYVELLVQAAVGVVALIAVYVVLIGAFLGFYVGMWGRGGEPQEPGWGDSLGVRARVAIVVGTVCLAAVLVVAGVMSWFAAEGVFASLTFLGLLTLYLPTGLRRIEAGLAGAHRARWRAMLVLAGLVALLAPTVTLLEQATGDAARVHGGRPAAPTFLGFRLASWGAHRAAVAWTGPARPDGTHSLQDRCFMFLGQSDGTDFLYEPGTDAVVRAPAASVVVRTTPGSC
jgi:hypothetical protein